MTVHLFLEALHDVGLGGWVVEQGIPRCNGASRESLEAAIPGVGMQASCHLVWMGNPAAGESDGQVLSRGTVSGWFGQHLLQRAGCIQIGELIGIGKRSYQATECQAREPSTCSDDVEGVGRTKPL